MSGRRLKLGIALAALAVSGALVPGTALAVSGARSHHHHAPTARQIEASKAAVARREREVRRLATIVGTARQHLHQLNVTAEVAFEAYDGAQVKLATAQHAANAAHLVLDGANAQVAKGQHQVERFLTAAYESGGLSSLDAYLAPGGPAQLVARVGDVQAISSSQHTTVQRLTAAQLYRAVVSRQASAVAAKAATAAAAATRAKSVALAAVHQQTAELTTLRQQRARLATMLSAARSHVSTLQREHLAALARARARAAARAAAAQVPSEPSGPSPYAGSSGSTAGTVSAATEAAALQAAESQLGKPYVWGAAGPDSYDCSGLVTWAYGSVGVSLDHFTGDQWQEGAHISQSELRPGDLVFFAYNTSDPSTIHHVGMYVGNGEMIDAPYTGVDVRYDSALRPDYIGAVRPYQR